MQQRGMQSTSKTHRLPNTDRLSILAATILLAYALARFIDFPAREFAIQLPGFYLSISINLHTIVTVLVSILTAAGAEWLIHDHPAAKNQSTVEHWLLPALTAWIIGRPLFQVPIGPVWWAGFLVGGGVLILVLLAEYVVVDPQDGRHATAAAGLTVLSFALYLALAVTFRFSSLRLYLLLPTLSLAAGLVSLRVLHLRLGGQWAFVQAGLVALFTGQLVAALYYWPLTPVSYGLALLGPAYALTIFFSNILQNAPRRQVVVEPLVILGVLWVLAFLIK